MNIDGERMIEYYYGTYKKKGLFGKTFAVNLFVYPSRLEGNGFLYYNDELANDTSEYNIAYKKIKRIFKGSYKNEENITIEYRTDAVVSDNIATIILPGMSDVDKWLALINKTMKAHTDSENEKRKREVAEYERKKQMEIEREEKALQFYKSCYDFHIKEETPTFKLFESENKVALIYVDDSKALHFLKIDGYEEEESNGIIAYDNIHYYEKAGNVHFTTDIHGNYSSYGGSMTGGSFSKLATVGGGLLFGLMGMGIGAALTYKPIKQENATTSFAIDSETRKIDDRSVVLNFYSDMKKQYIDIELPQDAFNFLQTYLPEKRMSIVEELEKKAAVQKSADIINSGNLLNVSERPADIALENKDSLSLFQQKIEKLKMMRESGFLSDEEFENEKKKLLELI